MIDACILIFVCVYVCFEYVCSTLQLVCFVLHSGIIYLCVCESEFCLCTYMWLTLLNRLSLDGKVWSLRV